jgi:serine protease AprX
MNEKRWAALLAVACATAMLATSMSMVSLGDEGREYYLVRFQSLPAESEVKEISTLYDATFLEYRQEQTYLVSMDQSHEDELANFSSVASMRVYNPSDKVYDGLKGATGTVNLRVNFHGDVDAASASLDVQALGVQVTRLNTVSGQYIECTADASLIDDLASLRDVCWIQDDPEQRTLMNLISSNTYMGSDTPQANAFRGSGLLVEDQDDGCDRTHGDLSQVLWTDGSPTATNHGTCTNGIMFGTGAGDANALGNLPEAVGVACNWNVGKALSISRLWNGTFDQGSAGQNGIIQTNSWYSGTMNGNYDANSAEIDGAARNFPRILTHWALGNSNAGTGMGLISNDCAAKNDLTVGAIWHLDTASLADDNYHQSGSGNTPSRGWAPDGRMQPDLCGPFDMIYTVDRPGTAGYATGNYYTGFGGTSGATPNIAGCSGLAYQMYKANYFGNNPTNAVPYSCTIKALMIADAYQYPLYGANSIAREVEGWGTPDMENMYNLGPDYHVFAEYPQALSSGQSWGRQVYSDGTVPLKITLCWIDPPAPAGTGTGRTLINNLDLRVTSPGGTVYWGNNGLHNALWSVSGTAVNNWTRTAGSYTDDENNVENVFIQTPQVGQWRVDIFGHTGDVAQGPQQFSVVASGAKSISGAGTVGLDKEMYKLEDTATVTVADTDLNTNPGTPQTVNIVVNSTREPAGETVTCTENGPDTSTFIGTITLSNTNAVGVLWVAHGNVVTATYNDANNGTGPATVRDTSTVDGQAPAPPTALTVQWYGKQTLEIYNQTFEGDGTPTFAELGWTTGGASNDWQIGTPSGVNGDPAGAYGGTYSIGNDITGLGANLRQYENSIATDSNYIYSSAINCVGYTSVSLRFMRWLGIESATYDHAYIEASRAPGGPWTQIWSHTGSTFTDSAWTQVSYNISAVADNQAAVYVRFEMGATDGSVVYCGWNIDALVVSGQRGTRDHNTLNWTLSADDGGGTNDVAKYNIYRSVNSGGPWDGTSYITNVNKGVRTYCDLNRGQSDGINWWYVVRAEDNIGNEEKNVNAVPEQLTGAWTNVSVNATGWNMVSLPIRNTAGAGIPWLFADQAGATRVLWDRMMWFNPRTPADPWKQYNKNWPSALNDLTAYNTTMGVWLNVTQLGDGLIYKGGTNWTNDVSTAVQVKVGWNLVGFPSNDAAYNIGNLKADCAVIDIAQGFMPSATYRMTNSLANAQVMGLGRAYWVHATADGTWNKGW